MDWKAQAEELYFESGMGVGAIADYVGVSRQSVSGYLKSLPGYEYERRQRKEANAAKRKEYKRQKNREYRAAMAVTGDTMRREHDIAAVILSREKYSCL